MILEKTKNLVKNNIHGTRKGSDTPTYIHSYRVYDILESCGYDETICLAGLLHDIVEDSPITFEDLLNMGYSKEIVSLVSYCTHNDSISDSLAKWLDMMTDIIKSNNMGAFVIKVADITDNLTECHLLAPEKYNIFMNIKATIVAHYCSKFIPNSKLFEKFLDERHKQRQK